MFLRTLLLVAFQPGTLKTSKSTKDIMKTVFTFLALLICIQLFAGCRKSNEMTGRPNNILNTDSMKLKITIGTTDFTATLYNNATIAAFKTRLPMTVNIKDLNANEKYFD